MAAAVERELLKSIFPNPKWFAKVNKMTDEEVVKVVLRLKQQGKIKVKV